MYRIVIPPEDDQAMDIATCTETVANLGHVVHEISQRTERQIHRHTHYNILHPDWG